jgi:hypothetical protein
MQRLVPEYRSSKPELRRGALAPVESSGMGYFGTGTETVPMVRRPICSIRALLRTGGAVPTV